MDKIMWFKKLQELSLELYGLEIPDDEYDSWECYYRDGYPPKESLNEDMNNG